MSELVDQLRLQANHASQGRPVHPAVLRAAADKIEQLQAALADANDAFDEVTSDYLKQLVAGEPWRQL